MKKATPPRIVEITLHRSKRNPRLGYAVATLFPCNHHKKLGFAVMPKNCDFDHVRVNNVRIVKVEEYIVTDKEYCYQCPSDLPKWIDSTVVLSPSNEGLDIFQLEIDND